MTSKARLPNAADPAIAKRIADARAQAARLLDDEKSLGRKQLQAKARASEEARDHAFHTFHLYEYAVGGLQIAIVLASVSVVTRMRVFMLVAGILGGVCSVFALLVAQGGPELIERFLELPTH